MKRLAVLHAGPPPASLTKINLHAPTDIPRQQFREGVGHKFEPGFPGLVGHSLAFDHEAVSMISEIE